MNGHFYFGKVIKRHEENSVSDLHATMILNIMVS